MAPRPTTKKTKASAGPIVLANWGRRFIAWLVDYIIINVMLAYFQLEEIETTFLPDFLLPKLPGFTISIWSPLSIFVFFVYWTLTGWYFGRSIGQLLVNVRLTDLKGQAPSLKASAVQSVGKSLLLPFDCLVGWFYGPTKQRRQRFFNFMSNTIVTYIGNPMKTTRTHEYVKEA